MATLKDRRNKLEKKRPMPTSSTMGSKKMYRKGEMITKPSVSQSFQPAKKPVTGVDPNRKLYEDSIKTRKSGTKKR